MTKIFFTKSDTIRIDPDQVQLEQLSPADIQVLEPGEWNQFARDILAGKFNRARLV